MNYGRESAWLPTLFLLNVSLMLFFLAFKPPSFSHAFKGYFPDEDAPVLALKCG